MSFQTAGPEGRHDPGRRAPTNALTRRIFRAAEPSIIGVHSPWRPDRSGVEAFLEAAYSHAFRGVIRNHFPYLVSLRDADGSIRAAVGFRFADSGRLYLEQYLDQPVELALAAHFGVVGRPQIAEVGNLAAREPAASLRLFLALARRLHIWGATHVVATATLQLRRTFSRLGLEPTRLTRADPARLADGGANWGAYYAREPEVLAGAIAPCLPRLVSAVAEAPR
jgi:Thermostable hemolysin